MKIVNRRLQIIASPATVIGNVEKPLAVRRPELVGTDPEQPIALPRAGFAGQQFPANGKQRMRLVGALAKRLASRQQTVIGALQFQCQGWSL